MNRDFDSSDPLWTLLDRASQPLEAGPFFARNAVRHVRSSAPSRLVRWAMPFAFATLAVGFLLTLQPLSRTAAQAAWEDGEGGEFDASRSGAPVVAADLEAFFDAAAGLDDLVPSGDLFF